jgi:hypothetical protein
MMANLKPRPVLSNHVVDIVRLAPEKKMTRPATGWPIALMANKHAFGNHSVSQEPGRNVCHGVLAANPNGYFAVTVFVKAARPHPARSKAWVVCGPWSVLVNAPPESFWERNGKTLRESGVLLKYRHSVILPRSGYWPSGAFQLKG